MRLKTSEEWQKVCKIRILDPDGWDRENFDYSWYEEKITRKEFEKRLYISTCEFSYQKLFENNKINMWKDI